MKKLALVSLTAAALAVPIVLLAWRTPRGEGPARSTEVARVVRRDLERGVTATGVIKPRVGAEVRVGSRASGVVRRLLVRIGDTVRKGEILAELETGELEARRAQTAAAMASARADLDYAEADLRRKRELAALELLPRSELDLAERASTVAAERLREAKANLDLAATQLGYARIASPIAGVVASISTQEGETVAASFASPTFVTLLDLDRLEVRAYVDETDIGRIRIGQPASFTVDTYPGQEFAGEVVAVYPQAEIRDNVVNYVTVVRFQPPSGHTLRPEMTATVRIALETRRAVLAVPRRAVRREAGRQYVLLRRGNGTERRWVKTGGQDETFWEIGDGLREGDEVLVGGGTTDSGTTE
ncbi:MAG TPA: efflux RND transporter periplasmic adaptor subunit [Thermoanaerobaculia bacterium]|jgi:RND family efflux transporter MFP subunit|nr:efflux RND transporter periplasmic adaptor subunit [Thermoanaerobaculia bacterium]